MKGLRPLASIITVRSLASVAFVLKARIGAVAELASVIPSVILHGCVARNQNFAEVDVTSPSMGPPNNWIPFS